MRKCTMKVLYYPFYNLQQLLVLKEAAIIEMPNSTVEESHLSNTFSISNFDFFFFKLKNTGRGLLLSI